MFLTDYFSAFNKILGAENGTRTHDLLITNPKMALYSRCYNLNTYTYY